MIIKHKVVVFFRVFFSVIIIMIWIVKFSFDFPAIPSATHLFVLALSAGTLGSIHNSRFSPAPDISICNESKSDLLLSQMALPSPPTHPPAIPPLTNIQIIWQKSEIDFSIWFNLEDDGKNNQLFIQFYWNFIGLWGKSWMAK